ncbi:heme NO-binding domain-containing protein [Flavobacterium flavipallidum]|uniref:Heme NO-binding domain-containing protein n=1 Tax=Flavobacterium flavipallidum TaxID=3139140 RepID=A0ABU9HL93_9FLAO
MYGVVNKSIEDLIITNFGKEKWENIKSRSGIDVDFFISSEAYDDSITFKLAQAAAEEMQMSIEEVLVAFGEWWIVKTTSEKYPGLMSAGGVNLKEFLLNLPVFHNRVMLIYPKLTPPEFKLSHIEENSVHLHYYSARQGLQEFVRGLLQGIGKLYNTPVGIELLENRQQGNTHDVFKINW